MKPRLVFASAVAAGIAVAAGVAHRLRSVPDWPEPPGDVTTVRGESLHHLSSAEGAGPTVVFESALSCPCTEWAWVMRELDGHLPYLAYDRPGNGWSSAHNPPRTAAEHAELLHDLLVARGLPGPYVLVGHSVGGLLVRVFADRYPGDVAGLVLVDSSHPDQLERSALQREGMPLVQQSIWTTYWRSRLGLPRPDDGFGALSDLPEELVDPSMRVMRRPEPWKAAGREFADWYTRWNDETRATTLGPELPVAVVTAGAQSSMDGAHARMQEELAQLTTVGHHDVVVGAQHDALVMRPEPAARITRAVDWVVRRHHATARQFSGRKG